ncbi:MAG: hypothetical protein HBSAPP03_20120 [Phycisphaerae bacterium]|nr:MAG: hypothetical protein HBSAPP03_20120 [Phycisphaerae bacterium]
MPHCVRIRHVVSWVALATCIATGALPLIGCRSFSPVPAFSDRAFEGPPISIAPGTSNHTVVIEAPHAGWSATLSCIRPGPGHQAAFVTIRKPFPGVIYAQAVVTLRVGTGIPSTEPIHVYARVVEHDAPSGVDDEYTLAAAAGIAK